MLLIHPPLAKPCDPPAGIAQLAGALRGHGRPCTLIDCNLEGLLFLLSSTKTGRDTWSKRALKNKGYNLKALRSSELYTHPARYRKAVAETNRLLENSGRQHNLSLNLANYQDPQLSPLKSTDLLQAAEQFEKNIFFPYFSVRLEEALAKDTPSSLGISLNYLSQALTSFAIIGFIKKIAPDLPIVAGGGLLTSWMHNPAWTNLFTDLIDHLIAGQGEIPLLKLANITNLTRQRADFDDLPLNQYFSPGRVLPYAASSGCFWNKCSFCPETTEENPYIPVDPNLVLKDLKQLTHTVQPSLVHFLDNAMSPAIMKALIEDGPQIPWYSFARVSRQLTDIDFCRKLHRSGCRMLKLGIESGDQHVLDAMNKGIELDMVSRALTTLQKAGIASYVYLLFGTPHESQEEARSTLSFTVKHHDAITYLNLAIFNMPVCSHEAADLEIDRFYQGDLSLYNSFDHPRGWDRKQVRMFLDREFKRHPRIAAILRRDPPFFTSNHAPFF